MNRSRSLRLLAAAGTLALGACGSPEAERTRGGGRGADTNNRDAVIEMHQGSRMYYDTPCLIPDKQCTGPLPASGLPGDFPAPRPRRS